MTDTIEGRCPQDCVMCRYDRHIPAEPSGPTALEGAVAGFGVAASFWISCWIVYRLGVWIDRLDFGPGSFILATGTAAVAAAYYTVQGRR